MTPPERSNPAAGAAIEQRSRDAACLDQRVVSNQRAQQVDLNQWLFDDVSNPPVETILELCCGTGAQTRRLVDCVGPRGSVVALDASRDALDRLSAALPLDSRTKLRTVEARLEDLDSAIGGLALPQPAFDWEFCAYGLYYTANFPDTLAAMLKWLRPSGRLTVVGPFGPNNSQLFALLDAAGITLEPYVRYTSGDFMLQTLLPALTPRFEQVEIRTLRNPVVWRSAGEVLDYWTHTTFYEADRRDGVAALLTRHFAGNDTFVNDKWIMRLDATALRSDTP